MAAENAIRWKGPIVIHGVKMDGGQFEPRKTLPALSFLADMDLPRLLSFNARCNAHFRYISNVKNK